MIFSFVCRSLYLYKLFYFLFPNLTVILSEKFSIFFIVFFILYDLFLASRRVRVWRPSSSFISERSQPLDGVRSIFILPRFYSLPVFERRGAERYAARYRIRGVNSGAARRDARNPEIR